MKRLHCVVDRVAFRKSTDYLLKGGVYLRSLSEDVLHAKPITVEQLGRSSNNCSSFKIKLKGQMVKCYECLSPERAQLIQQLSAILRAQGIQIPKCIGIEEHVIFAEWVEGSLLDGLERSKIVAPMAAYQATLHKATISALIGMSESMPHIEWLFSRVLRYGRAHLDEDLIEKLRHKILLSRPLGAPWGILHSDFITNNVVVAAESSLVSIDNEFLSVGYGQEWDILNTLKVSFGDDPILQDRYLEAYARLRSLHTLISHRDYWEACYQIKMAGKRLSQGRVEEGISHLKLVI